ncbi:MAG: class I SAM-dependent methyltransferase [archaeon]
MRSTDWDKIAPEYYKHIDSPFSKGVKNSIFRMIRKVADPENGVVLEVGCGTGALVPFLSRNFKRVIAVDISKKMVEIAQEKNSTLENVEFKVMDMLNITRLQEKFDVIVAVNSIIMPNIVKVNKVLKKIYRVLKRGGTFIGIFPSFDATVYHALITYDKEFEKRHSRKKAKRATNRLISQKQQDFCYGFFCSGGKQKHFYGFELIYRLRLAGFKKIRLGKVEYPWESVEFDPNPKRFLDEKVYDRIWDWIVHVEK